MNIRTYLNFNNGYYLINREERNLAAIFYHLLLQKDNLHRFLKTINCSFPIVENELAIYFEYSFLRDLWYNIDNNSKYQDNNERNNNKRNLILEFIKPLNIDELFNMSIYDFNNYFGAVPSPSSTFIQSPGNWSIRSYNGNIKDNDEFLKVCKFKWCFNAKPDIVIHTSNDSAICIEAKLESEEGHYPSNEKEKKIFYDRGIKLVGQLNIQEKIMVELLGIKTEFKFLVKNKVMMDESQKSITWKEVFSDLDISDSQYFIKEWLKRPDINYI